MELGALICTPTLIKCNECPLNQKCMSYEHHTQMFYPIKTKNKKSPEFSYKTLLIVKNHQILMSNDDLDGLMKGFYRLPQYDIFDTKGYNYFEKRKHLYSHKTWNMEVYIWNDGILPNDSHLLWIDLDKLNEYPIIGAHLKILKETGLLKISY